jgi:hypothetical protein
VVRERSERLWSQGDRGCRRQGRARSSGAVSSRRTLGKGVWIDTGGIY